MGWWPFIFGGSDSSADPVNQLDPKLREFLEKESPLKYKKNSVTSGSETSGAAKNDAAEAAPNSPPQQQGVPTESLYQDGRYAHLWKNYRPQAEVEAESMSDHERLMSVLEAYQQRKSQISKVAMENCAEAQEEWVNCMKHGKLEDQLQMCRHQVKSFEKCYTMQSVRSLPSPWHRNFSPTRTRLTGMEIIKRFLRALGYGSVASRPQHVEDAIQMHADSLYQRVLQHELAVEKARNEGTPVPVFDPTIPLLATTKTTIEPSEELQLQWKDKLDQLPESERPAEEAALRADLQSKSDVARSMKEYYESQKKKNNKDGEGGGGPTGQPQQKTFADTIVSLVMGR
ncbi:hypothetical protein GMORB2_3923 [Geosmithia morbida]|uniref:Uncharacterized protein n=1 Tax=Geosmithia morbida TaxID=1094350 RepID=A0A9P4Z1U0_9HYPO|nr:uncharacterized protein GMORB2_3923 [Geosmithia morbida]KAF4125084.1 hypothetical protein GMORB2_3923 [Geosmithia morbida]